MAMDPEREATIIEEAKEIERFVDEAREATDHAYALLRDGSAAACALADALPTSVGGLFEAGHGPQARALVQRLAEALRADEDTDSEGFARGLQLGFAAGCLVQWRILEYLVGEEMPLWPVQTFSAEQQVD
ncbi:MAG: hypothetical protein HY321_08295 [Armatimonadetes bacterium]|nr:hypothetical protein [Armatimonadota bacterium]